jgi:hypothetical protein
MSGTFGFKLHGPLNPSQTRIGPWQVTMTDNRRRMDVSLFGVKVIEVEGRDLVLRLMQEAVSPPADSEMTVKLDAEASDE